MIPESADIIGLGMIAIPAMLGTVAVVHLAVADRIGQLLQHILRGVDRIIQVVAVHIPHIDMDLPFQLPADLRPIPLNDMR